MRHIGSIDSEPQAQRFQAWLDSNSIGGRVEAEGDEWAVWIHHEDHVEQARAEFEKFQADPTAEKYSAAVESAKQIHRAKKQQQRRRKKVARKTARFNTPSGAQCPVTFGLIALSVIVAMLSNDPKDAFTFADLEFPVLTWLRIEPLLNGRMPAPGLSAIQSGQVWRVITPIFIHFGILHLLFNMLWLHRFAMQIEFLRGSWRLIWLVLVVAATSNLVQYYFQGPLFGGMSGVVYGLFGYIWMRSKYAPNSGFYMPQDTVVWMMVFFVICSIGALGPVANWCHGIGLIAGMGLGTLPVRS